jgi:hypothetical protein
MQDKRSTDDFVGEVVEKLDVEEAKVRQIVTDLQAIERPSWGNSTENLEHFKTLRTRIERLQTALRAMPDYVRFMTFAPENSETLDTMQEEALGQLEDFTATLGRLRTRCDKNIAAKPGVHGNFHPREHQAAIEARLLMEQAGMPVTRSETSLFNDITDLLCRAAWGGPVKDRKQACNAALSAPIRTE